jgi:hypothetical protein
MKMIIDLNLKPTTLKFLEGNIKDIPWGR